MVIRRGGVLGLGRASFPKSRVGLLCTCLVPGFRGLRWEDALLLRKISTKSTRIDEILANFADLWVLEGEV